jgi:hypothetical protein
MGLNSFKENQILSQNSVLSLAIKVLNYLFFCNLVLQRFIILSIELGA